MNSIRIEGHICEGQELHSSSEKREVRVTVIRGGASVNGYYYNEAALRAIANLLENAQAYVDHARSEADNAVRSVRDMVGFYHSPAYIPPDTSAPMGRVDATLHILESAGWLWSIISEACALGHPELIGLSIDIYGMWQPRSDEPPGDGRAQASGAASARRQAAGGRTSAQPLKEVTSVLSLNSCDIVTRPSAGGAFQHILHSKGEVMDPTTNEISTTQNSESTGATPASAASTTLAAPAPAPVVDSIQEQVKESMQAANAEVTRLLEQVGIERSALMLERRLLESQLPQPPQKVLRDRYKGRIVEEAQLDADIVAMKAMLGELTQSGMIRGEGYSRPMIGEQITEAEKIQGAFDAMFGLEIDKARLGNIVGFSSIREAYARVTGDPSVAGFTERSTLGAIRVSEAAPITRISEADTTTASFSYLLGTSMNKRLLKDYQAWPAEWQRFVTITPIKDFKQQTRVRLGAFGSLSTVAEDTAYTTISLTDSAATYVPTKRGNLVTVSRETIVNDDLFAIKQIPTKLAVAAAYTLAEFVYAFLSVS